MDDMERYGDYNEIDAPPEKNKVLTAIKIVALVLIFSVIGILAFRLILFNYYPSDMKKVCFNDTLTDYYNEKGGEIIAKTQTLKAPYDDEKEGNFMCDNLVFFPEVGQLQISLRLNRNLYNKLDESLPLFVGEKHDKSSFSFRLRKTELSASGETKYVDAPSVSEWKTVIMYDYCRIVFDGADFTDSETGYWMVLEVYAEGQTEEKPFAEILLLDSTELFYQIKDYKLSGGERPR